MADPDKIFLALKSQTRRKILNMLASEPMYLTQIAFNLDLGQQAIFRHLQLLEESGILISDFQDSGQGAPRRYYQIARAVRVEVQISPEMFDVGLFDVPTIAIKTPEEYPELEEVVLKCRELSKEPNSKEKLIAYSELLTELSAELKKINIVKSIAEATYSNIRNQIRKISFELLPQRIDQRIIQALATRGGESTVKELSLILHLAEETIAERLVDLEKHGIINLDKKQVQIK
ncbi:MAG: ArsR family transcriptional regulator [Candidatus Heimdallarchaeota archaeon]